MSAIRLPVPLPSLPLAWLIGPALIAAMLAGHTVVDGAAEPAPDAPSCVGCHSGEAPPAAPDDALHALSLSGAERAALAARLAPGR